ncbi:MAG: ABC transporter permease [Candidatus Eremiobacteraeota bacterium]|nr:ABC transporter permease [Candidatus Eremiobacteraeota bacterium]
MNVLAVIYNAEFLRRITSRSFLAGTVIGAVGILLISVLPNVLGNLGGDTKRIALAGDPLVTATARTLLARDFKIVAVLPPLAAPPTTEFLDQNGRVGVIAELSRDAKGLRVVAYARDPSQFRGTFARDLAPLQIALGTGLPVTAVREHLTVPVEVRGVGGKFADESSAVAAKGVAYLFVFLLYLAILLNAQSIMASVAEEKTSRIAELLVAAVDPAQLLTAKVLASASTGFIQLGVWVLVGILSGREASTMFAHNAAGAESLANAVGPLAVPPGEVLGFIAFFFVGFLQYAVLYAAAASLINRTEDLGSVAMPLVIPVVVGFILAQIGLNFPNAPWMQFFSQVPLLSPFVMFTRIAVSNVPVWQVVLSLALDVVAAYVLVRLAGKVYRVGLLLYGRPPSFRQILVTLRS